MESYTSKGLIQAIEPEYECVDSVFAMHSGHVRNADHDLALGYEMWNHTQV